MEKGKVDREALLKMVEEIKNRQGKIDDRLDAMMEWADGIAEQGEKLEKMVHEAEELMRPAFDALKIIRDLLAEGGYN